MHSSSPSAVSCQLGVCHLSSRSQKVDIKYLSLFCQGYRFAGGVTVVCCCCLQDTDENGMMGGEIEVALHQVAKGEVPAGLNIYKAKMCST